MAYYRKLPSGVWEATVRDRSGARHSFTDPLKAVARQWAREQEARYARGDRRDPRAGQIRASEWHRRRDASRGVAASTKAKNTSLWRSLCEPEWADWPMDAITRMEAQEWINRLEREEAEALYEAAGRIDRRWRTFIELGTQVGLRFEEIAGLHGHRVDWLRGHLTVVDVMTRAGLRQWPKSKKSHRTASVPAHVMTGMSALMTGRARDALVFTAPAGGAVDDGNFRDRVWYPAIAAAGIRRFPPRIMRHTAASWLVQDGVPLYDVQALLGHESFATTQRYAHLAPGARTRVMESWARRLDASVTHDRKEGRS